MIAVPFLLILLLGLALLLRPHHPARVLEVANTYTRQEKTGQRSSHRRAVAYADVVVDFEGEARTVTVRDNTWQPIQAGDSVTVARGLLGGIVEYRARSGLILVLFAALMGPACLLLYHVIDKRRRL